MAFFPVKSLWPARVRVPVVRLVMALFHAPLVVTVVVTVIAFVIAGMTAATGAEVLRVTIASASAFAALIFGFTLTFGIAGFAVLWRAARRGVIAWAVTGLIAGAIFGALFSGLAMNGSRPALVIAFAIAGLAIFLLMRGIAGIRTLPPTRDAPRRDPQSGG